MGKKIYVFIIVILSSIFGAIYILSSSNVKNSSDKPNYKTYQIRYAAPLITKGKVTPEKKKNMHKLLPRNAEIDENVAKNGDFVHKGQIIYRYHYKNIDPYEIRDHVNSNNVEIRKLNQKAEWNQLSIYEQEKLKQLNLLNLELQEKITENEILAPFDGYITVSDSNKYLCSKTIKIVSNVSEYDYSKIKEGKTVKIKVLSNGTYIDGIITNVNRTPNSDNSQSISKYEFDVSTNNYIQYGMSTEIEINSDLIPVPTGSVVRGGVYVKRSNKFKFIKNSVYKKDNNYYADKERLAVNEKIVLNPGRSLSYARKPN